MKRATCLTLTLLTLAAPIAGAEEPSAAHAQDKLELPGTSIIGNQELPIGLDIVPWRPAAPGDVKEGPTQLLDEPLRPVDPEVFRRELQIYQANRP